MKKHIAILSISCIFYLFVGTGFAGLLPQQASSKAEAFTALIDLGQFEAAYNSASPLLKLTEEKQDWIKQTQRQQKLLGQVQHRSLRAVRSVSTFPQLPDGDYLVVQYLTQTQYKQQAAEIILLKNQETDWVVCSYSIR